VLECVVENEALGEKLKNAGNFQELEFSEYKDMKLADFSPANWGTVEAYLARVNSELMKMEGKLGRHRFEQAIEDVKQLSEGPSAPDSKMTIGELIAEAEHVRKVVPEWVVENEALGEKLKNAGNIQELEFSEYKDMKLADFSPANRQLLGRRVEASFMAARTNPSTYVEETRQDAKKFIDESPVVAYGMTLGDYVAETRQRRKLLKKYDAKPQGLAKTLIRR